LYAQERPLIRHYHYLPVPAEAMGYIIMAFLPPALSNPSTPPSFTSFP
jgi:hypothetical protein